MNTLLDPLAQCQLLCLLDWRCKFFALAGQGSNQKFCYFGDPNSTNLNQNGNIQMPSFVYGNYGNIYCCTIVRIISFSLPSTSFLYPSLSLSLLSSLSLPFISFFLPSVSFFTPFYLLFLFLLSTFSLPAITFLSLLSPFSLPLSATLLLYDSLHLSASVSLSLFLLRPLSATICLSVPLSVSFYLSAFQVLYSSLCLFQSCFPYLSPFLSLTFYTPLCLSFCFHPLVIMSRFVFL